MKIGIKDGVLKLYEFDSARFTIIKSWGLMKWDRKTQAMYGKATMELLDKLTTVGTLPPILEAERLRQHAVAEAVDAERMDENPKPFYEYPVKTTMFRHQIRGANMAMLVFGFTTPEQAAATFAQEAAERATNEKEVMQDAAT